MVKTIVIAFICLFVFFIVQNLKKFFYSRSRIITMHYFWTQNGPFSPNFVLENYYYHSHLPFRPFYCAKCKQNSSSRSRVMRMCKSTVMRMYNFWAQNGPFPQMRILSENLLMSLVSFIHAYLHAKNQSQILIY